MAGRDVGIIEHGDEVSTNYFVTAPKNPDSSRFFQIPWRQNLDLEKLVSAHLPVNSIYINILHLIYIIYIH